jgi:DNA-damage-inducible protein J
MTTLNIRIEERTKMQATKTLASLGLDMSSAIKLFLNQVIVDKALPFTPKTRLAGKNKAFWDAQIADAIRNGKPYSTVEELFDDLNAS